MATVKEAYCKNCGNKIHWSGAVTDVQWPGIMLKGWTHSSGRGRECNVVVVAEPDRDRSSDVRKQSDFLEDYDIGGEG